MKKSEEVKIQNGAEGDIGRWCVVETNVYQERRAKFHLSVKGVVTYLPMRAVAKKRRSLETAAPLFPGYLFAPEDMCGVELSDVFGCIGVRGVLSAGGKPRIAPAGMVEAIKRREVYGLVQLDTMVDARGDRMKRGTAVKITDGPLQAYDAIFEQAVDARRVQVMLSLFGRRTRVTLSPEQLERAS